MNTTELLVDVFRFAHFVGLAALLGGLLVQIGSTARNVNAAVLWGAVIQLVSGLVLLALTIADANHLKVTVKLILLLVVLVIVLVARRRSPVNALSTPAWITALALTVVNVALAVFW